MLEATAGVVKGHQVRGLAARLWPYQQFQPSPRVVHVQSAFTLRLPSAASRINCLFQLHAKSSGCSSSGSGGGRRVSSLGSSGCRHTGPSGPHWDALVEPGKFRALSSDAPNGANPTLTHWSIYSMHVCIQLSRKHSSVGEDE